MIYTYECQGCYARQTKTRRVADRHNAVSCECGAQARLVITPVAVNTSGCTFEGFQAHGVAGRPVITNQKQRKDMMARHDLVDANETFIPPTHAEQAETHAKVQESVNTVSNRDGLAVADIV